MMGMLSHIVTTYPNTAQSNVTSQSGDCMHWTCLLLYCLSIASRPINNKNGAKKVYVCYSVFPKCENHENISVMKKRVLYCKFTYLDIDFKDVYNRTGRL